MGEAQLSAFVQDAYFMVNARAGIAAADDRWSLALVGTNLANEAALKGSIPFFTNVGYLVAPRRIAVQARYRFGSR